MASRGDMSGSVVDASTAVEEGSDGSLTTDAVIPAMIGILTASFSIVIIIIVVVVCRRRTCSCASPRIYHDTGYVDLHAHCIVANNWLKPLSQPWASTPVRHWRVLLFHPLSPFPSPLPFLPIPIPVPFPFLSPLIQLGGLGERPPNAFWCIYW